MSGRVLDLLVTNILRHAQRARTPRGAARIAGLACILLVALVPLAVAQKEATSVERLVLIPARAGDADGDGLPDSWERARASWGLDPAVPNLVFVPVYRPEVTTNPRLVEIANQNIARMAQKLRDLPVRNAGNLRGIHLVVRPGRQLSEFYRGDATPEPIDYKHVRSAGMPPELIGYAHGMLIAAATSGGGQTSGPDWSGVPNSFPTMIHELGHQLGLDHEPRGSRVPSPLYTSLMNYDYNYSFNGSADLIHFSRGKFARVRLNERSLDEVLPFSAADLGFLSRGPYQLSVQARGTSVDRNGVRSATSASVDWNRNGVHGERGIRADVNDGYALALDPETRTYVRPSTGDVALAAHGDLLVAITTEVRGAVRTEFAGPGATPNKPARLGYTTVRDRTVLRTGHLISTPLATGPPTAIQKNGRVIVAFPATFGTIQVGSYSVASDGTLSGSTKSLRASLESHATLVDMPAAGAVALVLWDPETQRVQIRRVETSGASLVIGDAQPVLLATGETPLVSTSPPGAVLNTRTNRVMLVVGQDQGSNSDRLRLWTLESSAVGWRASGARWLGSAAVRSPDRPAIAFDAGAHTGPDGRYLVYYRAPGGTDDVPTQLQFARVVPPQTVGTAADAPFVTRERMYFNEWSDSRNAPVVAPYQGDFSVLWRVGETAAPDRRNQAELNHSASGEFTEGPADFDDVTHIATTGLWSSITGLRR